MEQGNRRSALTHVSCFHWFAQVIVQLGFLVEIDYGLLTRFIVISRPSHLKKKKMMSLKG